MHMEIRLIRESEYITVNDFFNNTCGINAPGCKTARDFHRFRWEFLEGPPRKAIYAGAWEVEEGKEPVLAGIQCVIIHQMISADGHTILAAKGEDTLIDIRAIGNYKNTDILKELFTLLTDECMKLGVKYLWGFNNIPATYRRLGFDNAFKSFYAVLVLNPVATYKQMTAKPGSRALQKLNMALLAGLSYAYSARQFLHLTRKQYYHIDQAINDNTGLFQRAATPGRLLFLQQDDAYLDWRIRKNPYAVNYRSFQFLDRNNILRGQVICSVTGQVAFIEQTLFDKSLKKRNVYYLLKTVIQALKNENICMVRHAGFNNNRLNSREMGLLHNLGFVSTGKGEWFTFKKLSDDPMINPENIYLSRLYKQGIN